MSSSTEHIEEHVLVRFEIDKCMGKGAYGIVWKVKEKATGRTLALKKIFDAFANEIDAQRTYREVMYLRELYGHENIVRLEEVIKAKNHRDLYLIFEFMDADLHHVVKAGLLGNLHKKYIVFQLFRALRFLHSAGIVHRDLKPSNLLLNADCLLKLADFGLARSIYSKDGAFPVVSEYVATRWYRAPEILLGSRVYCQQVDVWSAGCILAELHLGRVLFPGKGSLNQVELLINLLDRPTKEDLRSFGAEHADAVISSLSSAKTKSFTLLFSGMGPDGLDLIRRMLCFNPDKRITVDEVLAHPYLQEIAAREEDLPTRSIICLPVDDNLKMSVEFYRDALYKAISPPLPSQIASLQNHTVEVQAQGLSANHKSSTSKERFSTKDVSSEKRDKPNNLIAHSKSRKHNHDFDSSNANAHMCSQMTSTSGKKSLLTKKKSIDKSLIAKKDKQPPGKKASLKPASDTRSSVALIQNSLFHKLKSPPIGHPKGSVHSSTMMHRRPSQVVVEECIRATSKAEKKKQGRSISPPLAAEASRNLLRCKSAKSNELNIKRSTSPSAKEFLHTLAEIKRTEQFFKQFDPMKKKASLTKSTKPAPKQKVEKKLSTGAASKKTKLLAGTSLSTKAGGKGLNSSSHLIGVLKT